MQVGFLLSPASYKGMSAHVSVRFLLLVIGVFTLGGCDATSTAVDKAMATPHRLIEGMRECHRERINHRAEHCTPVQAEARTRHDVQEIGRASCGDRVGRYG